ncbi:MAG: 6-carboxytetrahydropterin synthase QueD [Bacteroidia bacterium]
MLSITKIFHFEAAHTISCYNGQCKNIHGHSYELHVTITGQELNESNMLIDFKELKKIVEIHVTNDFDHALILKSSDENVANYKTINTKIHWLKEEPTAEFLVMEIAQRISTNLPSNISLKKLKLFETASCYAEWEND